MFYPITVKKGVLREDIGNLWENIDILGKNKEWKKLLEFVDGDEELANSTRPVEENVQTTLNTPLHHAALGSAPKDVFKKLLQIGSAKCLKNSAGETAYDIGVKSQLPQDVLELIKIPQEIKQKQNTIKKFEEGLHKAIMGRVDNLINDNKQVLPQVALLFEKGSFFYSVPGMYGGFKVERNGENTIQASSWIRVYGGSGQTHEIDSDGNVKLIAEGFCT
ncbi:uncharacterized protein LOC133201863 [Saccostrea echinata]|uniref:uncharacterized protein LOC133201863 n=1 Tax=Saccostrea echinata TaxID=191078 RepID=UPI002A830E94|nr:uncharacterized protein LOC133201863 [Saccostrea echinata]